MNRLYRLAFFVCTQAIKMISNRHAAATLPSTSRASLDAYNQSQIGESGQARQKCAKPSTELVARSNDIESVLQSSVQASQSVVLAP